MELWNVIFLAGTTSLISGVFGMAGGMVLMGFLPLMFTPAQSILLHGIIQGFANGTRSFGLRGGIDWRGVRFYALGSLIAFLVLWQIQFVPNRSMLYFFLAVIAFAGAYNIFPACLGFQRNRGALLCGVAVSGVQLVAGVAGPLLDLFFRDRKTPKERVVATKSVTQVISHALKVALMVEILRGQERVLVFRWWELSLILAASAGGTYLGRIGLQRMSQDGFYLWTSRILGFLGFVYLVQALRA